MNQTSEIPLESTDDHGWNLIHVFPENARAAVLWLPALGVAAKHYLPLAQALADQGIAVFLHEWRGNGSSDLRPSRAHDWGYREILSLDLPASLIAMQTRSEDLPLHIGGHSLGGQLSSCFAALHPQVFTQLWLVASGTPFWRYFSAPRAYLLPFFYRFLPWLAQRRGRLNGRRLGFGGIESRSLIGDWARVGLSGRYAAAGMQTNFEAALSGLDIDTRSIVLSDDWLAPLSSLQGLTNKLGGGHRQVTTLNPAQLGAAADHFAWMRQPAAVAIALAPEA